MMLEPPMNQLLEQVPSRYMLVNVVAQRARQIASAAEDAGIPLDEKPVTLAIPSGGRRPGGAAAGRVGPCERQASGPWMACRLPFPG